MKLAIPMADGLLAAHFGHCQEFAIVDVDADSKEVTAIEKIPAPVHQPGMLPGWLRQMDVTVVIAGGMGMRAIELFTQMGIDVCPGAPVQTAEELVAAFLKGSLQTNYIPCDHSEGHGGGCDNHDH